MAIDTALGGHESSSPGRLHGRLRLLAGIGVAVVVIVVAIAVAAFAWAGISLTGDETALAHVSVQPFGGTVEHVQAIGPNGRSIPVSVTGGLITPLTRLTPGETVSIDVTVRRPGWLGWALGKTRHEQLTLQAPVARIASSVVTVPQGGDVAVAYEQPVSAVAYGHARGMHEKRLGASATSVSLGRRTLTGTLAVAAAARSWEKVGRPVQVSWFPASDHPVLVSYPTANSRIGPATHISLTFSKPVEEVLGASRPSISPHVAGHWVLTSPNTLVFKPAGAGAPLGTQLHVQLPHTVSVAAGGHLHDTSSLAYTIPDGSLLRLQQLLAQAGYLPVDWHPDGPEVAHTPAAEAQAAVEPPSGSFSWRYPNTPHQLQEMWSPGQYNVITKGAIMKFENLEDLTIDGEPGPNVWKALVAYALAGKHLTSGYTYVYVHREIPETLTLWHDGHVVLTTPANTGIAGAETALGTYPVFEHIPEGTMSGTNPDGSHYEDPGIKWISYFNGGDALHNFDRASFGTPQSLGCVELPLQASAEVWPYTPIGTLVTIEV